MDHRPPKVQPSPHLDARMLRTRAALLDALLALLEEQPFDQITIREITRRAGVGYATFFRRYPSKEALLDELASDQISAVLELSAPMLYEVDSLASCMSLCGYVADHRKLWSALLTGGAAGIMREAFVRQAKLLPLARPSMGATRQGIPEDLRVVCSTTATIEVLAWWMQRELGVAEIAHILNQLVIAPTIARAG